MFLYKRVLDIDLEALGPSTGRDGGRVLPTVPGREDVRNLLRAMRPPFSTMAELLYGSGLRQMECVSLRVKDLDFDRRQLVVRDARGATIASGSSCARRSAASRTRMTKSCPHSAAAVFPRVALCGAVVTAGRIEDPPHGPAARGAGP